MKNFPHEQLHAIIESITHSTTKIVEMYDSLTELFGDGTNEHSIIFAMWLDYLEWAVIGLDEITRFMQECNDCRYYKGISPEEIGEMIVRYKKTMSRLTGEDISESDQTEAFS